MFTAMCLAAPLWSSFNPTLRLMYMHILLSAPCTIAPLPLPACQHLPFPRLCDSVFRESLGRFPDMAVRERFLEQMRTYMIGGTAATLSPDSPHPMGQHALEDSTGSLEDSRERLRQQHMQQQQQQQQVRNCDSERRSFAIV